MVSINEGREILLLVVVVVDATVFFLIDDDGIDHRGKTFSFKDLLNLYKKR
jgi:hypothetical protein